MRVATPRREPRPLLFLTAALLAVAAGCAVAWALGAAFVAPAQPPAVAVPKASSVAVNNQPLAQDALPDIMEDGLLVGNSVLLDEEQLAWQQEQQLDDQETFQ